MSTSTDTPSAAPTDAASLTPVQKLAVLLIMLGTDSAAQVLKSLEESEVEAVCSEMAKFTMISQELQHEILKEFTNVAIQATTSITGGAEYTQGVLEKGVGLFKASNIISRVSPNRTPLAAMSQIADLEAHQIFNLIKQEHPQTVALVASYLSPEKAAQVVGMMRGEAREQVVERLATLAPTPIEVVERIVEVLSAKLGRKYTRALNQTGGLKAAANLLNAADKSLSKALLLSLEERNPKLGLAIRQKMFTFEDLAGLDTMVLQRVMREVEMRDLAVALKTASEQLKGLLLGSISKRAAETVNEEISFMGPLKLRDIEAAQLRIIEVLRRLEAEGEIDLGDGSEKAAEGAVA